MINLVVFISLFLLFLIKRFQFTFSYCIFYHTVVKYDSTLVNDESLDGEKMNCWKTINLQKDVGQNRILFLSIITMIFVFILTYLPINLLLPNIHLKDEHFFLFVVLFISLMPIHKLCHALPLLFSGNRVSVKFKQYYLIPVLEVKACNSIKKGNMILSLLFPFIFMTAILCLVSIYFTPYVHYICIAMAFHIGLCVPDFIFLKQLLFAPKMSLIEEYEDGYEVLIKKY